jgi:hypothetical protein
MADRVMVAVLPAQRVRSVWVAQVRPGRSTLPAAAAVVASMAAAAAVAQAVVVV